MNYGFSLRWVWSCFVCSHAGSPARLPFRHATLFRPGSVAPESPRFDYGIMVGFGLRLKTHFTWLPKVVELVFRVRRWRNVNHHEPWLGVSC